MSKGRYDRLQRRMRTVLYLKRNYSDNPKVRMHEKAIKNEIQTAGIDMNDFLADLYKEI